MLKSIMMPAVALAAAALLLLPMRDREAVAQAGPHAIIVVDLDIVPGEVDKYLAAIKENGAASVKEPGCRQFDIAVSQKDPNHVLIFEEYDNTAAVEAHRATDHFKKYQATVAGMVARRELRQFSSAAMNMKGM